jgi:predicted  nucleic acid-binding Zn-ribbon protein
MATKTKTEIGVSEKLDALYKLQSIDSQVDKIRTVRGELPLEVQDLEDEIVGLNTRAEKVKADLKEQENVTVELKNKIVECNAAIKKYTEQQKNVRNNREFESLSKEIEFQTLEIQLCEKRIKENKFAIDSKKEILTEAEEKLARRQADLVSKKGELDEIVAETEKEEEALSKKSATARKNIDERLLFAYDKLRTNAKNGLAVVQVVRDSCGGCFNSIPPQRQMEIEMRKKITICEHCGRILVPNQED